MNPFYLPYRGKPPIVELWPECRPKIHNGAYELHRSGEYFDWRRTENGEYLTSEMTRNALALTRCAVLEACGKVLHETLPDGRVQLRDEFVGQRWVFHLGEAASLGNDITINELAHQLCDVKEQP